MTARIRMVCLSVYLVCTSISAQTGPRVSIATEKGTIIVMLDSVRAPRTSANFLRYVDSGYYRGGSFFRTVTATNQPNDSVRIAVIQGGIAQEKQRLAWDPVRLEDTRMTGLRHLDGTISMARSAPHTATWSFFICIGEQPELDFGGKRNADGQGFAAFGKVDAGMDIVRTINASEAAGQSLTPPILIHRIERVVSDR